MAFKGIPFAAPPVGDLRWRPPEPVVAWDGVRHATAPGPVCMQGGNCKRTCPNAPPTADALDSPVKPAS